MEKEEDYYINLNDQSEIDKLLPKLRKNSWPVMLDFITTLMEEHGVEVEDLMSECGFRPYKVLDEISDSDIEFYCEQHGIWPQEDDEDTCGDEMDEKMLDMIHDFCHSRHSIVDMNTVLDDIREFLTLRGYDKRLI